MFNPVKKQAYKLELFEKCKIYDILYMLRLDQNYIKKVEIDKNITELKSGNSIKIKVEAIQDSAIYARKSVGYLLGLYYQIS